MTARMDPAVKGRNTGWWYNDEPSALRRGEYGQEGVSKYEIDKNKFTESGEENESGDQRGQALKPRDRNNGEEKLRDINKTIKGVAGVRNGRKVRVNKSSSGPELNLQSFDEAIREIERRDKNGALLHSDENVDLILLAIDLSPPSDVYPHPRISKVFEDRWKDIYAGEDNVASWAGKGNLGLKPKRDFKPGEILGVYGGIKTNTRGPYVLEVTQTGGPEILVDAEKYLDGIGILGRINEDIHTNTI